MKAAMKIFRSYLKFEMVSNNYRLHERLGYGKFIVMSFKENLLKKIKINQVAKQVAASIGPIDRAAG